MKKIAIIGAGISGLFIANLFKKNSDYQVVIYEKSNSINLCLLYTSPSPRDVEESRMPSSA